MHKSKTFCVGFLNRRDSTLWSLLEVLIFVCFAGNFFWKVSLLQFNTNNEVLLPYPAENAVAFFFWD